MLSASTPIRVKASLVIRMKKKVEYPKELLDQLGKKSDLELSKQFKIPPTTIRNLRTRRGIVGVSRVGKDSTAPFVWTKQKDALIGTMPDTIVAIRLEVTVAIVRYRRAVLGIDAYVPPQVVSGEPRNEPYNWTPEQDQLLGTMHDTELARQLTIKHSTVTYRRLCLGIEPYRTGGRIDWTDEMIRSLGTLPDNHIAAYFEIAPSSVKLKRLILNIPPNGSDEPEKLPQIPIRLWNKLGKVADTELEKQYNIPRRYLRVIRAINDIPTAPRIFPTKFSWDNGSEKLLGTMSDANVARKLNIAASQIRYRRQILNIPAFGYSNKIEWNKQRLSSLGKKPDHILAKEWGYPQKDVCEKRESLNIKAKSKSIWKKKDIALLGTMSDKNVAQRIGLSATCIINKRKELGIAPFSAVLKINWTKTLLNQLGKISDSQLAFKMGVHTSAVHKKRVELGILPAPDHRGVWIMAKNRGLLGTMSDPALGKKLGVTASAVRSKRVALGIPAFK